ncbi:helix-turn-helix domain-containing protein [Streptomyces fuscichromogenes]|uniref:Transcriptional regulator n=1 Tax=Streptomyces fuscichromogenes TaxID=1324013 RepID=A0A917XJD4_9ACTN|nr:helix-turn-helix transcriptional regulator [Streptomyces fuscichromogenes]GGN32467.1 transcriptional regulator [Streptomyces fuscichromogenes]
MSAWDGDDRGKVPVRDDVEEFAALLRQLKDRTDRSYGSLARRLNMNTSTLHRYCAGEAVPLDFAPVERLAAFCGATPQERLALHEHWLRAVAARRRPRTGEDAEPEDTSDHGEASDHGETPEPAETPETTTASGPAEAAPVGRPWYRRRRPLVASAVVTALLATLGSLAALPDDRPSTGATARGTGSSAATATTATTDAGDAEHHGTRATGPAPDPASATPSASYPSGGARTSSPATPAATAVPLTWTANSQLWELGCDHDYVIDKQPSQVPPPPAPQDAGTWAATQSAVHGGNTIVDVSVQGRSSTAVVLEDLRVRVVGRTAPAPGIAYSMADGCGGGLTPRYFDVNLDKDRPIARPVAGEGPDGKTVSTMHLPYRVSATDPEVLRVKASTVGCDCRWYLELDWSSQGRSGTVRVDDHGRPFRTSSVKGLPHYWYGNVDGVRQWVPAEG